MEITNVNSFLSYMDKVRERTTNVINIIPRESMDWVYKHGKFTVADQVRHIAAIERCMFAENIAGRKSSYAGCGKNLADGYENVLLFFKNMHKESVEIIGQLMDDDLQKKCTIPSGMQIATAKWLRLMIEHEIHHRG